RDRERGETGRAILSDGLRYGLSPEPEPLVGRQDPERLRRKSQHVEGAGDGEVRLIAGVYADALERPGTRGTRVGGFAPDPREVYVPSKRHPHEVRHHAARGQHAPAPLAVPDEVP